MWTLPLIMSKITREQFMEFFRSDDFQEHMSDSDTIEIFSGVLKGASDFTPELLNEIFRDYGVTNLIVVSEEVTWDDAYNQAKKYFTEEDALAKIIGWNHTQLISYFKQHFHPPLKKNK